MSNSSEDWKVEYEQLSADDRFIIQTGWQAAVAVLGVDGLIVGAVIQAHQPQNRILGFLPLFATALTFIMARQEWAWADRWLQTHASLRLYHLLLIR